MRGKKLVWKKFLQHFVPDVCCNTRTFKERTKEERNFLSFCVTFRELSEINSELSTARLIIFDETAHLDKELDSSFIRNSIKNVPCIFSSASEVCMLQDLQRFHKIVTVCGQELTFGDPFVFINTFCGKAGRKKLRGFIQTFYLEYLWNEIQSEVVPEITKTFNSSIHNEANFETQSELFDCDTVIFIPKEIEGETCNMSPLQYDSKSDIYDADTQPFNLKANISQSGFEPEMSNSEKLKKDDLRLSDDLFKENSLELQEIESTKEVIIISSGSTITPQSAKTSIDNRCMSPDDLFSDADDDYNYIKTQNKSRHHVTDLDSPIPSSLPLIKTLERCNTKISTPIAQLVGSKAFQDSESPIGYLSPNFWGENRKKDESVFEITKNEIFGNVMRINENNEISPVTERPVPKFDWSPFTKKSKAQQSEGSPMREQETHIDEKNNSSLPHTPTFKRTTTPCSSRSSSKKVFKSGEGWLNKYSPVVSPITPKNRRKRLETIFNEISTPVTDNLGQDMLMSPTDIFE